MLSRFPDPRSVRSDIVAIGDDLRPETLVEAYRRGIFPWPVDGLPLPWFCPRQRAVLDFDDLHLSRSLTRTRRLTTLEFTIDRDFEGVIRSCADTPRPEQAGTWIFPEIIDAYRRLHALGHAHSVEAWRGSSLVGGIYGVDLGGAFGGESMFFGEPNASKLAFLYLVDYLVARGLEWMDVQVMTPHMEAFGAKLVSRREFLRRVEWEQQMGRVLFPRE